MNYILRRLTETSTWRGIYISLASIVAILFDLFPRFYVVLGCAIATFIIGQILVWTKDYEQTDTILDDILYAAASAFKFSNKDDK